MCKECKEEKVRKVFLDDLPRREGKCNKIYWAKSIGYKVSFIYDDIKGEIEILDFNRDSRKLKVKYNDAIKEINNYDFSVCKLNGLLIDKIYKFNQYNTEDIWINMSTLPLKANGIDWENTIGMCVNFKYQDIQGEIKIIKYIPNKQQLVIQYLDNKPFCILTSSFLKCKIGGVIKKYTKEFKIKTGTHFKDDKRDIIIIDRKVEVKDYGYQKYNKKDYKYKCNKCGFDCREHYKNGEYNKEYWIEETRLLKGAGCACCCPSPQIVVPEINSIVANEETHWMIPYFQGGWDEAKKYTPQSNNKVFLKCVDCGRIKNNKMIINNFYKRKTIDCSCGDSITTPEKMMMNILEQLNIEFITQYSPNWCKYTFKNKTKIGFYDFYIPSKNLIIEMDGGLGHGNNNCLNNMTSEESIYIDNSKDDLAINNNLKIIRIDCNYGNVNKYIFIKNNILKSELNNIFDLSKIDWLKCEEFALSNLCKKACEIKRDNPEMTTTEIGLQLNLDGQTIRKYLKYGNEVWDWCNYNTKEEIRKSSSKQGIASGKCVEIFKDEMSLGIFPSLAELSRQSENLFGIKLISSKMSLICTGKQKTPYKGFTFKYVEDMCNKNNFTKFSVDTNQSA